MTLTAKDSSEIAGQANTGSPSQNLQTAAGQSLRSSPACLEVPVSIRSLPGEDGNPHGTSGPTRQEGKTVIVFDNAAVLRIANPIPPGQKVILSNQQGRDVVCRVEQGRNLHNVKGYIEVQFIEPVEDFWCIRRTSGPGNSPSGVAPSMSPPARPVTPPAGAPKQDLGGASSNAPGFEFEEDAAALTPTFSPVAASENKKNAENALASPDGKGSAVSDRGGLETAKSISPINVPSSISNPVSEEPATPPSRAVPSSPARKSALSNDFMSKGLAASALSPGTSRGRMPMIVGGAFLVLLVGLGAGYFLMPRASTPALTPSVPLTSQPAASAVPLAVSSEPAADQATSQAVQPDSAAAGGPVAVDAPASSDARNARRPASIEESKQVNRAPAQRQTIPSLKMSSPVAPGKNSARIAQGIPLGGPVVVTIAGAGGTPAGAMLSSVVRTGNQPAPPAELLPARSAKTVREAKLISSTPPVYPAAARQSNVQGNVVVAVSVDTKGNVVEDTIVSGPMFLRQAALDAVKKWKYSPALIDGKAAPSRVTVALNFRLN